MTIQKSEWANNIKKYVDDDLYNTFIKVADDPDLMVNIFHKENLGWVVEARNIIPDFYLDVCFTKESAISLCNSMGWSIR